MTEMLVWGVDSILDSVGVHEPTFPILLPHIQ